MLEGMVFTRRTVGPRGLLESKMDHLGRVVVISGPNGSGKSRVLQSLAECHEYQVNFRRRAAGVRRQLKEGKVEVYNWEREEPEDLAHELQLHDWLAARVDCEKYFRRRNFVDLSCDPGSPNQYSPSPIGEEDELEVLSRLHESTDIADVLNSAQVLINYLAQCRSLESRQGPKPHPAIAPAQRMQRLLKALLGSTVEVERNSRTGGVFGTLFGRRFDPFELSHGQRVLLCWATCLWKFGTQVRDNIITIDEPELHLHPDACIRAIKAIADSEFIGKHGQLWIATHSLSVIAQFQLHNTWFAENGGLVWGPKHGVENIERLLGGNVGRDQLHTLLGDIANVSLYKFAVECLMNAQVISYRPDDTQNLNISTELQASDVILDYGCGKARLAAHLADAFSNKERPKYVGYDAHDDSTGERDRNIDAVKGTKTNDLKPWIRKASVVVLCNVLHEIHPKEWPQKFAEIDKLLTPNGKLVIVEDLKIGVGELPTRHGFFLLDAPEMELLFRSKAFGFRRDKCDRLLTVVVPASLVGRVTKKSTIEALSQVAARSLEKLDRVRAAKGETSDWGLGHEVALYSLQHANASLALKELETM